MDTLTNKDNSKFIELKIRTFYKYNNRDIEYKEKYISPIDPIKLDRNNRFIGDEIFSFNEYYRVEITFLSNNPSDILEVECYLDDEEKSILDTKSEEYIKVLKPGDSEIIFPGGDIDDMLVPGKYSLKIRRDNIEYEGLYTIEPANTTWNELMNMKSYIENAVKGLSYNIYMEKRVGLKSQKDIENSMFDKYSYLNDSKDILISNLKFIINNPIINIEKVYKQCKYSKRPSNKSLRWMIKKGYNYNIDNQSRFYEKRSRLSIDVLENKILKNILEEIHIIIKELISAYNIIIDDMITKVENIEHEKYIKENKRNSYNSKKNIDSKLIANLNGEIFGLGKDINNIKKECEKIKLYICNLQKLKSNINRCLRESWINEIDNAKHLNVTNNLVKNNYYNQIYKIYGNLKGNTKVGFEIKSFPSHKTSKLYEIYNFLLVKDILEEFGFEWTLGWLKEQQNKTYFEGNLNSSDYIIMELNEYKAKVIYDKKLRRTSELRSIGIEESQVSAQNDKTNIRPDILIEFYKNDNFICGIVVELKCKKIYYMYDDLENTTTGTQIESYYNMDYYDGKSKKVRGGKGTSKVIAIFPKQKGIKKRNHVTYDDDIVYLPIMPSENEVEKPYGYEDLKDEIYKTLCDEGIIDNMI